MDGYEASVATPNTAGNYPMRVVVEYEDGTNDSIDLTIRILPFGRVTDEDGNGLDGARVSLYVDQGDGNFGLWDGAPYGMSNPQLTREDGKYGFIVPPGTYRVKASLDGFRDKETLSISITNNLVTRNMKLLKKPDKQIQDITDILVETEDLGEAAQEVAKVVAEETVYRAKAAQEDITEFVQNEQVEEQTEEVAAPVVAAVAVTNVAVAGATTATAIPYMIYLYSLLTHPGILFLGRRRKKWGIVYDAITKKPVDLAIVRLIDDKTGKIIRSMVTDPEGRYFFIVQSGSYRMTVAKNGYIFPTVYLEGEKEDARYIDLYHGETINASDDTSITANIPIDPVAKEKTPRRVLWEGIGRRLQKSISILSIIAMGAALIITPTPIVGALFATNVIMFFVFRRLAAGRKPKNWGIVYDQVTKRPLRNAVVRIFEAKYNKLLETKITDMRGRYAFLVGNNVYYVTFEKPGYRKRQEGPLDLLEIKKEEDQLVATNVGLDPEKPKNFIDAIKARFKSLFAPLSKEVASISKPPVAQEPKKGGLIVGPGAEIPVSEPTVEEKGKPEEKVEEKPEEKKSVPWELEMLQKSGVIKDEEGQKGQEVQKEEENKEAAGLDPAPQEGKAESAAVEIAPPSEGEAPWKDPAASIDVGIASFGASQAAEEKQDSRTEGQRDRVDVVEEPISEEPEKDLSWEEEELNKLRYDSGISEEEDEEDDEVAAGLDPAEQQEKPAEESSWEDDELERLRKEAEGNNSE
jgi:hypothetical protein